MPEITPLLLETPPGFADLLYGGRDWRAAAFGHLQPGVFEAGDFLVTAGAGRSVNVAPGALIVPGTLNPRQGLYRVELTDTPKNSDDFEGGGIGPSDETNPRIDQIVARVWDHAEDGSGLRKWQLQVVPGVPTGGATLGNRNGAAAVLPANSQLIADVRIPAGASSITPGDIRDRRPWARGARRRILKNDGDFATDSASYVEVPGTTITLECSGVPVELAYQAIAQHSDVSDGRLKLSPFMDGALIENAEPLLRPRQAGQAESFAFLWRFTPAPGWHTFTLRIAYLTPGTVKVFAAAITPLLFEVHELVRQDAANG